MRKTKIVCTLGFASNTPEVVGQMMEAGMNVARFNFSHGTHDSHREMLGVVVAEREKRDLPVSTLLDTKGPEIRLRLFENGKEVLEAGDQFILHSEEIMGTQKEATVSFTELYKDVKPGDTILFDDGLIELTVEKIEDKKIYCRIINGGPISDRKGVNVPDVKLSMPYVSEQDHADILFGIEEGFDFLAASFVRNAADVIQLREILNSNGGEHIRIISKIENAEGVDNIDEIIRVSDGIMVARGDMGVEIPFEQLPELQKMLIKKAYQAGKVVITATQMLESMVNNPRPTRAEVSDVANAVYDGTSAIMLSGESAAGKYPVEAVATMARIAERTESSINYAKRFHKSSEQLSRGDITNAISHSTCATAYELNASAIITVTLSGRTARNISKYRPSTPIIGCTTNEVAYRQMGLAWGVVPVRIGMMDDINELMDAAIEAAEKAGYLHDGEVAVLTTGVPLKVPGTTNLIKVHIAGDILARGIGMGDQRIKAPLCIANDAKEAAEQYAKGDILVVSDTTEDMTEILKTVSGVICEAETLQAHAVRMSYTYGVPLIYGVKDARKTLANVGSVCFDTQRGVISTVNQD